LIRIPGPLPTVDSSSTRVEVSPVSGTARFAQDLIDAAKTGTPLKRPEALRQSVRDMPSLEEVPADWAASLASDLARLTD
jgi:hypothetical protein